MHHVRMHSNAKIIIMTVIMTLITILVMRGRQERETVQVARLPEVPLTADP